MNKKKSLKYIIFSSSFYSVMAGFGETFLKPFAIALKATNSQIGMITSLPALVNSFSQLFSATLVDKIKKRKLIVGLCVFLQALIWLPILLLPLIFTNFNVSLLIFLVILYSAIDNFSSPPWASWLGDLINENERGKYFGLKQKIAGFVLFVSVFLAGYLLDIFSKYNKLAAFSILFAIAMFARFMSLFFISKVYEPKYKPDNKDHFSLWHFIRDMKKTNYGLFVIYTSFMNFAVSIASPFFVVYMLKDLNFSYMEYTLVIIASTISTFLAMTYWGRLSDKFGNRKIITVTGLLVPFVPLVWALLTKSYQIIILEVFSGFVWAGFNLSTTNFIFDNVESSKRAKSFAYFNLFNSSAVFIGASLGAFLSVKLAFPIFVSSLPLIFIISGILRLASSLIFLPLIKEVRDVKRISTKKLLLVTLTKPIREIFHEPFYLFESGMKEIKKDIKKINHSK